jgi:hypothetical protein
MGYFIVSLIAACVMVALAFYAYGPVLVGGALRSVYREIKHTIGTVSRRGWRPFIPWCFGALLAAIVYRVALGLPLPDSVTLGVILGPLGAIAAHATQVRSGDYRAGVANQGGLVSNDALNGAGGAA